MCQLKQQKKNETNQVFLTEGWQASGLDESPGGSCPGNISLLNTPIERVKHTKEKKKKSKPLLTKHVDAIMFYGCITFFLWNTDLKMKPKQERKTKQWYEPVWFWGPWHSLIRLERIISLSPVYRKKTSDREQTTDPSLKFWLLGDLLGYHPTTHWSVLRTNFKIRRKGRERREGIWINSQSDQLNFSNKKNIFWKLERLITKKKHNRVSTQFVLVSYKNEFTIKYNRYTLITGEVWNSGISVWLWRSSGSWLSYPPWKWIKNNVTRILILLPRLSYLSRTLLTR